MQNFMFEFDANSCTSVKLYVTNLVADNLHTGNVRKSLRRLRRRKLRRRSAGNVTVGQKIRGRHERATDYVREERISDSFRFCVVHASHLRLALWAAGTVESGGAARSDARAELSGGDCLVA
jgi:hypothetical protein